MIQNTQPAKMGIHQVVRGYRKVYFGHSVFVDRDVFGKAVWVDGTLQPTDLNTDNLYVFASSLQPNTQYTIQAAFYDQMIDAQLLSFQFGISLSDEQVVTTMEEPLIDSYTVTGEEVDVGVSPPVLELNFTGEAQQIEVQWSPTGEQNWKTVYLNDFESSITVANIPVGIVDVRIRGKASFPNQTVEYSNWKVIKEIELDWGYTPPSAPENLLFEVVKFAEPAERFDLKISWDWERGEGANSREFVVWRTPQSKFDTDGWDGAEIVNTGTGQSFVFINHPYKIAYRYRVSVIAWGPEADNKTYSEEATFIIDEDTVISDNFIQQTGIELNYAHILGRMLDGEIWRQTFLLDAATGAVAIGIPDEAGRAPINFDPVNGIVNVDGQVITNEIVAASFVLANFTGQDNPKLYSAAKPFYEDPSQGIFIGYDEVDAKFKFDLGDEERFIRWDGDELLISGNVRIVDPDGVGADTDLGSARVYEATVYKNSTAIPAEIPLSDTNYPPTGWTLNPLPRNEGEKTYAAIGLVDQSTGKLKEGENWGLAVQWSGADGAAGANGDKGPGSIIIKVAAQNLIPGTDEGKDTDYENQVGNPPEDGAIIAYQGINNDFVEYFIRENGVWNDFTVVVDGNQIINGTLAANKLQAESITGEYISSSTVITAGSGNNVVVIDGQSANWALYAGNTYAPAAPFRVTRDGKLYATNADISGIIRADQLIFNDGNVPWEGAGGGSDQVGDALNDGTLYPHQDGIQIRSGAYVAGATGWAIDRYGNAEFNNAVVRGTIFATNGEFDNVVINDTCTIAGATYFTPVRYDRAQSINIPLGVETTVAEFTFKVGQISNDFAMLISAIIEGGTPINENPATAVGRVYLNNKLYMSIPVYSGYTACCSGGPEGICYEYCTKEGFDGSLLLERAVIEPDNLINGNNTLKITMYHAGGGSIGTVKSVAEHVYLELARNL